MVEEGNIFYVGRCRIMGYVEDSWLLKLSFYTMIVEFKDTVDGGWKIKK